MRNVDFVSYTRSDFSIYVFLWYIGQIVFIMRIYFLPKQRQLEHTCVTNYERQ